MFAATGSWAEQSCQQKQQRLLNQLDYAKKYHNQGEIYGLEQALANVRAYCTTASVAEKRRDKIKKLQRKLADYQQALKEAKQSGKVDKIAKRQQQINETQQELLRLQPSQ